MTNFKKSNEYLLKYADEHITYEIRMFKETAIFCSNNLIIDKKNEWVTKNAILESFLIHMRNLIDFLYPKQPKKDDITINDYLSKEVLSLHLPTITNNVSSYRTRANKEIAHLTTKRNTDPNEKIWLFFHNGTELMVIYSKIIGYFSKENTSAYFIDNLCETIYFFNKSAFNIHPVSNTTSNN
jgi:hypothetical protein